MEEKKVTKISLSTFFLILSLIVIIVMGIFMCKFYIEKIEETKKSSELQTQVNSLNETVSDLQGKIDNISETINSNNSIDNEIETNKSNNNTITDNEDILTNNIEKDVKLNIGTFSVKNITDDELNDNVLGYIEISEDNKFSIPRTWRNV